MCAIAGIQGENVSKNIYSMLKSLKHRGKDGSGVFVDGKLSQGNLDEIEIPEGNLALGHNLLSIVGTEGLQPLIKDRFVLICNGEIYNYRKLKDDFKLKTNSDSDCEIILALIGRYYQGSLFAAVNKTIKHLHGDYAFAVYDGKNLSVIRDPVGVKPVYYGMVQEKNLYGFASERKALWKIGITKVKTLKPGQMLYNWKVRDIEYKLKTIIEDSALEYNTRIQGNNDNKLKNYLKDQLKNILIKSVEKRIENISQVGLMFSGGIDSTLLAHLTQKLGAETILYTVGHEDSADFKFARKTAHDMGLPIRLQKITGEDVKYYTPLVLNAIEEYNLMKLGVGMPAYVAAEMAHADGIKVLLSGQGADELFAGYHRYREFYQKTKEKTTDNLRKDIYNLYQVNLQRDDAVTMANQVELRVPYLDLDLINIAMNIPMKYKINDADDPLRKCILREIAGDLGVPDSNVKRHKKAAQYGSGIHKMLKRVLKDEKYQQTLKDKVNNNIQLFQVYRGSE